MALITSGCVPCRLIGALRICPANDATLMQFLRDPDMPTDEPADEQSAAVQSTTNLLRCTRADDLLQVSPRSTPGLSSNNMALITSDWGTMCSPSIKWP